MTDLWSQCNICENIFQTDKEFDYRCKAFPNGIPQEIVDGEFIHNKPYPGDNGILYDRGTREHLVR